MKNSKENPAKAAVKVEKKVAKNSVKTATEQESPKFSPKNEVLLSLVVCKGSITKKDGLVEFRGSHGQGKNPKTKQWNTPLYVSVRSNESLLEGICDAVVEGQKMHIGGFLERQAWEKDGKKYSKTIIVATSCTVFKGQMPSVNSFCISGFVQDDVKSFETPSGEIVRCSIAHPMGSRKLQNGEIVKRPYLYLNAVSFPKKDESKQIDNSLLEKDNLVIVSGSLKPNAFTSTDEETGEQKERQSINYSINAITQWDYNRKDEAEAPTADEAAEADE